jgi:hypothetical protein
MKFFSPYICICICICICIWYYMFPNTRKTFLRIARFYWDSRRWARNFLHMQEPHSRAPLTFASLIRNIGNGREGWTWYCTVRLSIFGFLLFLLLVFFWHREGGREGREVRNTVPQWCKNLTFPSRSARVGREGWIPHPRDGHLALAFKLKPSFKKKMAFSLSPFLGIAEQATGKKCFFAYSLLAKKWFASCVNRVDVGGLRLQRRGVALVFNPQAPWAWKGFPIIPQR